MSLLVKPDPVKPVLAVFSVNRDRIQEAARLFEEIAGRIDYIGSETVFDQTDYYREEMGGPLIKRLLSSEDLIDPADLKEIKTGCMRIEAAFSREDRRTVNLDPGYLAVDKLVLATGKNASHRVYIGEGVFAEVTLVYQSREFRTMPWTYPDFATDTVRTELADIRKKYLDQLRSGREAE